MKYINGVPGENNSDDSVFSRVSLVSEPNHRVLNRAEPFRFIYPENGAENVDPDGAVQWNAGRGGVRDYTVYAAADPDFENIVDIWTGESASCALSLEYGTTYYLRAKRQPMQNYPARWNDDGLLSFTTMSLEDKLWGEILSAKALLNAAEEGSDEGKYPAGGKTPFLAAVSSAEASVGAADGKAAVAALQEARAAFTQSRIPVTKTLFTRIYDDFTLDTAGERPLGVFFRSYNPLDVKVAKDPVDAANQALCFNDQHDAPHFGARYFESQTGYLEACVSLMAAQTNGAFSYSLVQTGTYPTESGVYAFDAARVVFAPDGALYGDKAKRFKLADYSANQWYDFKIVCRVYEGTYDVYLDGEKKAENVPFCSPNVNAVNHFMLDTSDGSDATAAARGVYYVDNAIVRTPPSQWKNPYLLRLRVNGTELADFDPGKYVYTLDMTADALDAAKITYESGKNARVSVWKKSGKAYVAVLSGDLEKYETYLLLSGKE
jgi:hypothetical protein